MTTKNDTFKGFNRTIEGTAAQGGFCEYKSLGSGDLGRNRIKFLRMAETGSGFSLNARMNIDCSGNKIPIKSVAIEIFFSVYRQKFNKVILSQLY